jgi:acetyl-CoA carboxylase biotin carboxyl carrier protein
MIDLDFLERLIQAIDSSSLDSVEIERGGTRIRLSKSPAVAAAAAPAAWAPPVAAPAPAQAAAAPAAPREAAAPVAAPAGPNPRWVEVKSPMVGTFYRSPSPEAPSYVDVGKKVGVGNTLCIIEAMKLMNELEAEVAGTIVEVCVENAQPVEYGQVLFRIDPA